jgi:mannitol-1-phosphate 5-dehydrogenase
MSDVGQRIFVGFGFGPIQAGLFLDEAFRSGAFGRLVVAEVVPEVVAALRRTGGRFRVNVATDDGIETHEVSGVEALNPAVPADRRALIEAVAAAPEMATALPSVEFYDRGDASPAAILAEAVRRDGPPCVLYAAENNNHAASILRRAVERRLDDDARARRRSRFQPVDTVIGKMSGVIADAAEIAGRRLAPAIPGLPRAFLVESFCRILIGRIALEGFRRGIAVFEEKDDLLPFEEAKLYGHNAVHALIGYLAHERGLASMADAAGDAELMGVARGAFLDESRPALLARHGGIDPLFTPEGFRAYAEDLLRRMINPHLGDQVARVIRDPRRKLGWSDRLVGAMRLALDAGVRPAHFARGAAAAVRRLAAEDPDVPRPGGIERLWPEPDDPPGRKAELAGLIRSA